MPLRTQLENVPHTYHKHMTLASSAENKTLEYNVFLLRITSLRLPRPLKRFPCNIQKISAEPSLKIVSKKTEFIRNIEHDGNYTAAGTKAKNLTVLKPGRMDYTECKQGIQRYQMYQTRKCKSCVPKTIQECIILYASEYLHENPLSKH